MARVLHVVPALAPRYGGPSIVTLGMCRALGAIGVETLVATTDADGPGRLPVGLERPETYQGARVIFFRRQFSEAYKWSGRLAAWLDAHVADFDAVHVHAVFSHSSIAAGRACRRAGVPYVVRPLGTLDPWSVGRKPLRKRLLFVLGADALLSGAAAIHYTSADEARLAQSVVPNLPRAVVVPNGIGDEMFATASAERHPIGAPYLLSLSRIDPKKGIDVLIRAFQQVASRRGHEEWRLVIAGDGEAGYVNQLKALAGADGPGTRVEFRGWVSGDEKVALIRDASLFVLASHQENFGISVAEAMAAAVPVLVTRGVNLAADVDAAGAGWIVDRPALADGLREAMQSGDERRRRGQAGRLLAERFRWPAVAGQLADLYRSLPRRTSAQLGRAS